MKGFSRADHLCVYNVLTCIGSFSLTVSLHFQVFLLLSLETFRTCNQNAFQNRTLRMRMFIKRYSRYKYEVIQMPEKETMLTNLITSYL
jgi:hypothetical protein